VPRVEDKAVEWARFRPSIAGRALRDDRISSDLSFLVNDFAMAASPAVSRAKSWSSAFSLTTPLYSPFSSCKKKKSGKKKRQIDSDEVGGQLPLNYLFAETLEAGANIGNVDILAPGLFAFSGGLSAGHYELWKLSGRVSSLLVEFHL